MEFPSLMGQPMPPQAGMGPPGAGAAPQGGITPELIQAMMAAGVAPEKLEMLAKQMGTAQQLRHAPGPEGRMAGNVYMAANPLEHIGQGIQKYRAGKQMKKTQAEQDAVIEQLRMGREKFGAELGNQMGRGSSTGPAGVAYDPRNMRVT